MNSDEYQKRCRELNKELWESYYRNKVPQYVYECKKKEVDLYESFDNEKSA